MADETEIVELQMSEHAQICVAKMQEVIAQFDLTASDAAMATGELFAWAHILGFMTLGKEKMLAQLDRSAGAAHEWANSSFDGFVARAEVVARLNAGESGGRLQ